MQLNDCIANGFPLSKVFHTVDSSGFNVVSSVFVGFMKYGTCQQIYILLISFRTLHKHHYAYQIIIKATFLTE